MKTDKKPVGATRYLRAIVVDEHPLTRLGIRSALKSLVNCVGEAGNGQEAVLLTGNQRAELVIMDVALPVKSGLEAARIILHRFPSTAIILLARQVSTEQLCQAFGYGVSAYVLKTGEASELVTATKRVLLGNTYVSSEILTNVQRAGGFGAIKQRASYSMPGRQKEVWQMIAEGQTTVGMALSLKISPKTIEYHRGKLMERLGIFDVPGLIRKAYEVGIVSV